MIRFCLILISIIGICLSTACDHAYKNPLPKQSQKKSDARLLGFWKVGRNGDGFEVTMRPDGELKVVIHKKEGIEIGLDGAMKIDGTVMHSFTRKIGRYNYICSAPETNFGGEELDKFEKPIYLIQRYTVTKSGLMLWDFKPDSYKKLHADGKFTEDENHMISASSDEILIFLSDEENVKHFKKLGSRPLRK
jgi:hypothetical protein